MTWDRAFAIIATALGLAFWSGPGSAQQPSAFGLQFNWTEPAESRAAPGAAPLEDAAPLEAMPPPDAQPDACVDEGDDGTSASNAEFGSDTGSVDPCTGAAIAVEQDRPIDAEAGLENATELPAEPMPAPGSIFGLGSD